MTNGCDTVGLASGVNVGSGVLVAAGMARAACVYSIASVSATWVKIAFMSGVGAGVSGEAHALRTIIKTTMMSKIRRIGFLNHFYPFENLILHLTSEYVQELWVQF